ncbi:hypothetical protein [Streptomyces sp. NPDC057052]|uniref:hypothetical protein n=1 Tax=Streptomyces sp. NPDC057052 TaxID=3346010 RepID=UPI003633C107
MGTESFTDAGKTRRNLRWTTMATVPCLLFLLYLIVAQGITEAWIGMGIVAAVWALIMWRFKDLGSSGLPPRR